MFTLVSYFYDTIGSIASRVLFYALNLSRIFYVAVRPIYANVNRCPNSVFWNMSKDDSFIDAVEWSNELKRDLRMTLMQDFLMGDFAMIIERIEWQIINFCVFFKC